MISCLILTLNFAIQSIMYFGNYLFVKIMNVLLKTMKKIKECVSWAAYNIKETIVEMVRSHFLAEKLHKQNQYRNIVLGPSNFENTFKNKIYENYCCVPHHM